MVTECTCAARQFCGKKSGKISLGTLILSRDSIACIARGCFGAPRTQSRRSNGRQWAVSGHQGWIWESVKMEG